MAILYKGEHVRKYRLTCKFNINANEEGYTIELFNCPPTAEDLYRAISPTEFAVRDPLDTPFFVSTCKPLLKGQAVDSINNNAKYILETVV